MITTSDSLQFLATKQENEFNILYADPPYALGSSVIVRPDGKVDYHKASDFMSKWEMPTGDYWDKWFKEAHRVLKNGGWLIMFGIDRQLLLFKYYALLAGFEEQQSLYWYFISNFPKATDLSKMIDKIYPRLNMFDDFAKHFNEKFENSGIKRTNLYQHFQHYKNSESIMAQISNWKLGKNVPSKKDFEILKNLIGLDNRFDDLIERVEAEREVIGELKTNVKLYQDIGGGSESGNVDITTPSTDLAKKYDGYKYSISPLKQTNETIMIFKKPSKTGSVLHDTLAFENGDTTINVSALDIDGNRVGTSEILSAEYGSPSGSGIYAINKEKKEIEKTGAVNTDGRYPAQTFIDNQVAEIIDEQSDNLQSSNRNGLDIIESNVSTFGSSETRNTLRYNDIGGASKILHKCNYEQDDVTLYHYEPKVSGSERNAGLGGFDNSAITDKKGNGLGRVCSICGAKQLTPCDCENNEWVLPSNSKNNHPTLKPIELNYRILKLFKLPTDQKICYPFAGSGSEIIGGIKAGFENWVGCEINAEYVAIANARINYWKETMWEQQSLFDEVI
jgi:DNA modification methylase